MLAEITTKKTFTPQHFPQPTCSQCREFDRGLCRLRAAADWGDASYVKADKKACSLASIVPF